MTEQQFVLMPIEGKVNDEDEDMPMEIKQALSMFGRDNDELDRRGIILINGVISNESLSFAAKRLLTYHFDPDFKDDIQVIINSPGGHLDAMWSFIDLMHFVDNRIRTIALGEICSAASFIFSAGDERVIAPNTSVMYHHYSTGIGGSYPALVAGRKGQDIEYQKIIRFLIEFSKYDTEEEVLKNILTEQDNWLTPQEMITHGLADIIYKPQKKLGKKKLKKTKKK